ncbi:hypothetical protein CIG75_10255 [Tumebacillus algifaecis]|uniref:Uncharacterized protein n=1 Tax=Tumebacillus algifaecis TaxID=1214604 RepID=A0A223D1S6_9BACL|nr:hypothetical protein CIG75_10255 [Tumebacillus algifaecis]
MMPNDEEKKQSGVVRYLAEGSRRVANTKSRGLETTDLSLLFTSEESREVACMTETRIVQKSEVLSIHD